MRTPLQVPSRNPRRLLFIVHRYPPFPGGSENLVQAMAEEAARRGHDVLVLAGRHQGGLNGVEVTSDVDVIRGAFDLVVVHGANDPVQSLVLRHAHGLPSPVLYLIIRPHLCAAAIAGLDGCRYLGYSTSFDRRFISGRGYSRKARPVRIGIDPRQRAAARAPRFKQRHGITTERMFLSAGGYWRHKGMLELANTFRRAAPRDTTMVFCGYTDFNEFTPAESEDVRCLQLTDRQEVLDAMAEADLYVMNSTHEGFGLVLLESMLHRTPWIARGIAAAHDLSRFGTVYRDQDALGRLLRFHRRDEQVVEQAFRRVTSNHLVSHTVDDIERVAEQADESGAR